MLFARIDSGGVCPVTERSKIEMTEQRKQREGDEE
jgi:hypothetical protein